MKTYQGLAAVAVVVSIVLTGCGGGVNRAASVGNEENIDQAADVYERFNNLEGEERMEELVKAAEAEGKLTVYSTLTPEAAPVVEKAFEGAYDIEVEMPRMSSEDVITKVDTEQAGGNDNGADLLELNGFELTALAAEGHFGEFTGPERDLVVDEGQKDGWTADRLNRFVVARNTEKLPDADWPKRIEDFADPKYQGKLSMEINEVDWFMALRDYYMNEKGMSEQEVTDLFKAIAANSAMVDGHAAQMSQLAAGKYAVAMSTYDYQTAGVAKTGAPLSYEPVVQPVVQRPNGVALMNSAPHPAAAYLFYVWILTDGQQVLREAGLTSALKKDANAGLDQGTEIVSVDVEQLKDEFDTYQDMYAEVTGQK